MTTTQDRIVIARAKAFSGEGVRSHKFSVSPDNTVRVWDDVAGHYTTCHCLSAAAMRRIAGKRDQQ